MADRRIHEDLLLNGPDADPSSWSATTVSAARDRCRRLASSRRENFSVLTRLVPADVRDDFAAVYAFCRTADDLGDEIGDPHRSLELLDWWRSEVDAAWEGNPRHWVFRALQPTIERFDLEQGPFLGLISAFEQDQTVTRYETWEQLIDYCRRSADPVGRLVLKLLDEPGSPEQLERSDAICTALQLTNHWQDLRRDLLDRDRIYIPTEMIEIEDFERRFRVTAKQGWASDDRFLEESRRLVRACVDRTWPLYTFGSELSGLLGPRAAPVIEVLGGGGASVLRRIEDWDYETTLNRPTLGLTGKLKILARAWFTTRSSRRTVSSREAAS
ncbi:MAG: squalene synthase HpnC [Planctomycetota bacterium]|jgi:squalene synthase HpnC|nr:squalene synthase HpnC [Planctomycetota bacterium]MDA1025161.1 squalene synthase HpnC [Planctomycetota bacterium]